MIADRQSVWTASELLEHHFPPIPWIVPGLLTSGLSLLVGAPKPGKSWLALSLAHGVATGTSALSTIPVEQNEVLYLALEDTPRRLRMRLERIGVTPADRLHIATDWRRGKKGNDDLRQWLDGHPETKLVTIDTWGRYGSVRDGNDYSEVSVAAAELKQIADERDISVVLVHHARKGQSEDFLESVLGSTGLTGVADAVMLLRRGRGNRDAVLHVTGRDIEEEEYALRFDLDDGAWTALGTTTEIQKSDARQEIYDWLSQNGPATPKAVWAGMERGGAKRSETTVRRLLRKMAEDGAVTGKDGTYRANAREQP